MRTKTRLMERGQALVIIALAAVVLFGFTALAIDGSAKFSDRRHAQNAADTAALAGALAKAGSHRNADDSATTWAKITNAALDRALENSYNNDLVTNTVEVRNPPTSGIYSNCSDVHFTCTDYVQVIITSHVNTTFARVFGIDQFHNRVEAVAATVSQNNNFNFGGNGIVALSPSGCALITGGNGTINVTGGGMFSNSDSGCAFKCNGSTLNANIPSITTVGGVQGSGCTISTTYVTAAKQIAFPPQYQELAEPAACSQSLISAPAIYDNSTKTATLQPGHYSILPLQPSWKHMILNPGVYCINTSLGVSDSLQMAPGVTAGVLLYFKPSSGNAPITINGGASVNIWGINSDNDSSLSAYTGFLMYFAPNYSLSSAQACTFNGNATSTYKGTIYAPYCDIKINGGAGLTMQSQLIGYTVDVSGNPGVILDFNGAPKTTWVIPQQVGLSK